ncbi:MAG: biotin transporter BioY [Syntrophales bacterium]|nr:biotin transporter BioY [Syntrophales bacterium]
MTLRGMSYAAMFGALTAVGAYISIPLPPVPITMQTFFVVLSGLLLGKTMGAMSQLVYLFLGIMGLPVFAGGKAGMGVLFGPTGGYLIGFVCGAYVIGYVVSLREESSVKWFVFSALTGLILVYGLGLFQLMVVAQLSFQKTIAVGLAPMIPGELIKVVLAALIAKKVKSLKVI